MKKHHFIIGLLFFSKIISAQIPDFHTGKANLYMGINSILSHNSIYYSIEGTSPNVNLGSELELGYYFNQIVGISAGIGFSTYSKECEIKNYSIDTTLFDEDEEIYKLTVDVHSYTEKQLVSYVTIPIGIHIRVPIVPKMFFCFTPCISGAFPLQNKSLKDYNITYIGEYKKYNITFDDLPKYGFGSNQVENKEDEWNATKNMLFVAFKAGFDLEYWNKTSFSFGVMYSQNILKNPIESDGAEITVKMNEVNSIAELSNSSKLQSLGGFFRVSYFIFR